MITSERGLVLKPHSDWDEISMDYEFDVTIKMDSDYAKCPDMKRIITGSVVYLNGASGTFSSSTQKTVSFSTTEVNAAVMFAKDALFVNLLDSLRLKVK